MVHFKANKVPYLLDWVQLLDWGHGRPLKSVNRILLLNSLTMQALSGLVFSCIKIGMSANGRLEKWGTKCAVSTLL